MNNVTSKILLIIAGASILAVSSLSYANCPRPNEIQLDTNKYWVSHAESDSWKSRQPSQSGGQVSSFVQAFTVAYDTTSYPPTTYKGMVCMYKDTTGKELTLTEVTPRLHQLGEYGTGHWQRLTMMYASCLAGDVSSCSFS
ncbi:MAG: DUF3757 domain-containing protein [Coxiellaceae bacterium]|nr:DUF3757 domain-containing protein [Coxiellaceae bacterium]